MSKNRSYSDETKAAVYGLRAEGRDGYFYVGVTKRSPEDRLRSHLELVSSGKHGNAHFASTVRKYGAENVTVEVLERPLMRGRWYSEVVWIKKLSKEGHRLTNVIHHRVKRGALSYVMDEEEAERALSRVRAFIESPPEPKGGLKAQMLPLVLECLKQSVETLEAIQPHIQHSRA